MKKITKKDFFGVEIAYINYIPSSCLLVKDELVAESVLTTRNEEGFTSLCDGSVSSAQQRQVTVCLVEDYSVWWSGASISVPVGFHYTQHFCCHSNSLYGILLLSLMNLCQNSSKSLTITRLTTCATHTHCLHYSF